MRWPWDKLLTDDDVDEDSIKQITVPADKEIQRTQERIERINRILAESRQAEILIRRMR